MLSRLLEGSRRVRLDGGSRIFGEGDACENYLFVLQGAIRVQKVSESGREIVLYRIEPGETCILTTSCLVSRQEYPAEAEVEQEVEALVVPRSRFHELLGASAKFRDFVFSIYGKRVTDLILLIEEVAFGRMDCRLAERLSQRAASGAPAELTLTHQELATELGTHREVVSRLLKEFERKGWVALGRGRIELRNPGELEVLARGKS